MEKIYSAKNDLIFKKIFGELKYKTVIKRFLSGVLDISEDKYDLISVKSPSLSIEENKKLHNFLINKYHITKTCQIGQNISSLFQQETLNNSIHARNPPNRNFSEKACI